MRLVFNSYVALLLILALSGCGGGGGSTSVTSDNSSVTDDTVPPDDSVISFMGVWSGTSMERKILALSEDDSELWVMEMDESYVPQKLGLFIDVTYENQNDFSGSGYLYPVSTSSDGEAASIRGDCTTELDLTMTVNTANSIEESVSLTENPIYAGPAHLESLAGVWVGNYGEEGTRTVTVAPDGTFTVENSLNPYCTFAGALSPALEGNLYEVIWDENNYVNAVEAGVCSGDYLTGLAILAPFTDADGEANPDLDRLYLLLTTENLQQGAVFMGIKQ
nr:hypothetical protein [uncultured Desulfuromonas sp.]